MATRTRGPRPTASAPARVRIAANGVSGGHIAEIQRARLLSGTVRVVDELGFARTSVSDITRCARVSRRTFYELFDNQEECFAALLDATVERVRAEIAHAGLDGLAWRERVRGGIAVILAFLDREPTLARVCVAHSASAGPQILARRERIAGELAAIVDGGRRAGARGADCVPLTAEGVVGAVLTIVQSRLTRPRREPLTALTGELMSLIVLPYLGPEAAREERKRRPITARAARAKPSSGERGDATGDLLHGVPMRMTYRTACVLEAIAAQPGISNRAVGREAGVADQGQISKLLARLERIGLLQNGGHGHSKGEPNAWRLTATGVSITQAIGITQGKAFS